MMGYKSKKFTTEDMIEHISFFSRMFLFAPYQFRGLQDWIQFCYGDDIIVKNLGFNSIEIIRGSYNKIFSWSNMKIGE